MPSCQCPAASCQCTKPSCRLVPTAERHVKFHDSLHSIWPFQALGDCITASTAGCVAHSHQRVAQVGTLGQNTLSQLARTFVEEPSEKRKTVKCLKSAWDFGLCNNIKDLAVISFVHWTWAINAEKEEVYSIILTFFFNSIRRHWLNLVCFCLIVCLYICFCLFASLLRFFTLIKMKCLISHDDEYV